MPLAALIPRPRSRRRATRLFAPVVLAGALVAGVLPAVARADSPIGVVVNVGSFSGDLYVGHIAALDIEDAFPLTIITLAGNGTRPTTGHAHLFDQYSGRTPMSDAQYAGLTAIEDEANAAVRARHGMSDTDINHDLVVRYDRPELLAALYGRLRQAAFDDSPTQLEQDALSWLVDVGQVHAVATATAAKAEFQKSNDQGYTRCDYRPPAPFTDWPSEDMTRSCRRLLPGEIPGPPVLPTSGQFAAWGDVIANPYTPAQMALLGNSSAAAIAWGAGAAAGVGTASALGIAQALTAGGLTRAIAPFAAQVATTLTSTGPATAFSQAFTAAGESAAAAATDAAVASAQLGQTAGRFSALVAVIDVAGIAVAVAAAVVQAVMAGIEYTKSDAVARDLDQALANAQASGPNLRDLLSSDSGRQQVLLDLTAAVPDCDNPTGRVSDTCSISTSAPVRRANDPVFQQANNDDSQSPPLTTSVPVSVGALGNQFETRMTIRDGWFMIDGIPTPLTQFPYVDQLGKTRIARLIGTGNGYVFQSEAELSTDTPNAVGSAYDPDVTCTNGYDRNAPCYLTGYLPVKDSAGNYYYVNQIAHRPPPAPQLTVTPAAVVGQLVTLGTVGGPLTTYDGLGVTERWSVESDGRCLYTRPDDFNPAVCSSATPADGPHGGWQDALALGASTVTWNAPGTWRVTQTRTDDYGVSLSTSADITVLPATTSLTASCTAPCAAVPGGGPVTVTGSLNSGASADREAVTIDWGDGTTTTGVPSSVVRSGTIAPGMTATRTSVVAQTFTAVHSYTTNINGAPVQVSAVDTGNGNPAPVTFVPATPPVADASSYGNTSADTSAGFAKVSFRVPVFRDAGGAVVPTSCSAQSGGVFPVGTTPVTCSATNGAGTSSVTFSVTVHSYTLTLVPDATSVRAGTPVTFVPHGTTDDGRDIGPITDQGVVAEAESADTTCDLLVCRRTSSWGAIVVHPVIGDLIVGPDTEVYTMPNLPVSTTITNGDNQTGAVGTTLPGSYAVKVSDAYGNPVPGAPVTLTVTSGDAVLGPDMARTVLVVTGPDGQVSQLPLALGLTPGPVTVTATTAGATSSTWHALAVTGQAIQGVSGNGQVAVIGRPVVPMAVRVSDSSGAPVAGVPVRFTLTQGDAALAADGGRLATVVTGADGIAQVTPVLGSTGVGLLQVETDSYGHVSMSFTAVQNTAPTAAVHSWSVTAGAGPLGVPAPGVLAGATDGQGDALTAVLVRRPTHGTFQRRPDGSFTYVPNAAYAGTDSFTWKATDGSLSSAVQTVTLNVLAANSDLGTALVGPSTAARGTQFRLTVRVSDRGPSIGKLVTAAVKLPPGMKVVKAPTGFTTSKDGRTALLSLPSLPLGAIRTYTLVVSVDKAATKGSKAISSVVGSLGMPDPMSANNNAQLGIRIY